MNGKHIKVLLIEDNPGDLRLIKEMIADVRDHVIDLICTERLSTGMEEIDRGGIDLLLLDLSLPDTYGLDTFAKAHTQAPNVPIVVLSGHSDEEFAVQAVQNGAQDYLIKGQVDGNLLVRAVRYAIERQRLQAELEEARQRERQERELRSLERLSATPQSGFVAQKPGAVPLRHGTPEAFSQLVQRYGALMDRALEQRAFKVDHRVSQELQYMAEELGYSLSAGPRDVVEIHVGALKQKTSETTSRKAQACVEEGRFMVLELMGHLAAHYRQRSLGIMPLINRHADHGNNMEQPE